MPQPFTDRQLAQIDAEMTRRAQAEDWRTTKPTKHLQAQQEDLLAEAARKAAPRRFTAEPLTDFGVL